MSSSQTSCAVKKHDWLLLRVWQTSCYNQVWFYTKSSWPTKYYCSLPSYKCTLNENICSVQFRIVKCENVCFLEIKKPFQSRMRDHFVCSTKKVPVICILRRSFNTLFPKYSWLAMLFPRITIACPRPSISK